MRVVAPKRLAASPLFSRHAASGLAREGKAKGTPSRVFAPAGTYRPPVAEKRCAPMHALSVSKDMGAVPTKLDA